MINHIAFNMWKQYVNSPFVRPSFRPSVRPSVRSFVRSFVRSIRSTVTCLTMDFVLICICATIILPYPSSRFSAASYSSRAAVFCRTRSSHLTRSGVWVQPFFEALSIKPSPLHANWTLRIALLYIVQCTPTLFLYFSFLQTGFSNLLIFSLTNKFQSFVSSTCFIRRRCKFSTFSTFSIRFCTCRFCRLLFFFSSAILVVLYP